MSTTTLVWLVMETNLLEDADEQARTHTFVYGSEQEADEAIATCKAHLADLHMDTDETLTEDDALSMIEDSIEWTKVPATMTQAAVDAIVAAQPKPEHVWFLHEFNYDDLNNEWESTTWAQAFFTEAAALKAGADERRARIEAEWCDGLCQMTREEVEQSIDDTLMFKTQASILSD